MRKLAREIEFIAAELQIRGRAITQDDLRALLPWGGLPRRRRLLYIAQLGQCGLCKTTIPLLPDGPIDRSEVATRDHVIPRFWARGVTNNTLLAHRRCNMARGHAAPTEEYLAFAEAVYRRLASFNTAIPQALEAREPLRLRELAAAVVMLDRSTKNSPDAGDH